MITWDDRFTVKISRMDSEHQELLSRINELRDAMKQGEGNERLGSLFAFLRRYAVEHFATEEGLMRLYNYSAMPAHRAAHEHFTVEFDRLEAEWRAGAESLWLVLQVQKKLYDWLVDHIMTVDREMGRELYALGAR